MRERFRFSNLTLREAASLAEIVSALCIVISLVYVGIQVSDSANATRSATASSANTEFIDWYTHLSDDPELMDVWFRGVMEPESLGEQETLRFIFLLHIIMLQFQNNYYLVESGTLEEKVLDSLNTTLTTIKGTPGFDLYWSLRKGLFYPEFRSYVEELMYHSDFEPNPSYQRPVEAN